MTRAFVLRRARHIFPLALASLLAGPACAVASTVDLSGSGSFVLRSGQQMIVQFSVWNYGWNNPGFSPYPTSIGLELIGASPVSSQISTVPGSGVQYFADYLLQATLESLDGSASVSLQSPGAALLGKAPGALLASPGMFYGNGSVSPVAAIDADATLSAEMSERIFGPNVSSRQSAALIVLRNLGSDLVIGPGLGSLRNAISEPSVGGLGNVQTSGITSRVTLVDVPEPGSIYLTLVLFVGIGAALVRRLYARNSVQAVRAEY